MTPPVTVLLDNYNYARFLPEALESALAQTWRGAQVVVVDDGSTDESREVLERYRGRVEVILKENGGQGSAFNAGFAAARGDWIFLLDADDRWEPDRVARVMARLTGLEDVALVRNRLRVERSGRPAPLLGRHVPPIRRAALRERIPPRRLLVDRPYAPSSALALSRRHLAQVGPIPEADFRISADAYLYTFLPQVGRTLELPDVLGTYRVHGANLYVGRERKALQVELALWRLVRERTGAEPVLASTLLRMLRAIPPEERRRIGLDPSLATRVRHLLQSRKPLPWRVALVVEELAAGLTRRAASGGSAPRP